jgi:hypothetical protein
MRELARDSMTTLCVTHQMGFAREVPLPAPHKPADRIHELCRAFVLDLAVGFADDAVTRMVVEQPERHLVEGRLDRGDLGQDIDAVAVVLDHSLQAADLALDTTQAGL